MSKLIYITNTSLDGDVVDEAGAFDWVNPDQVHAFIAELLQPIRTYLCGRRLYETMAYVSQRLAFIESSCALTPLPGTTRRTRRHWSMANRRSSRCSLAGM